VGAGRGLLLLFLAEIALYFPRQLIQRTKEYFLHFFNPSLGLPIADGLRDWNLMHE